jgi:hypothetical protein
MPLGVTVTTSNAPPTRGGPAQTDTLFLAGPAVPVAPASGTGVFRLRSLADFITKIGVRATANAASYDYVDNFFHEGGKQVWFTGYTPGAANLPAALARFGPDLGAGQVAVASEPPSAEVFAALQTHAATHNRVALRDVGLASDVETMADGADVVPAEFEEYGATFGPWVTIPAPAGTIGGNARQVPFSSSVAGLIARADALGNPNRAAAGPDFPLQYATGFVLDVLDADQETLLDAGINTGATKYGVLQNYGFQTTVEESEDTPFWQFNCARARMWLVARAEVAGAQYVFKNIDGRGRLARALQTDLDAVCLELYNVDGLYGETPADAFTTEVGVSINTEATTARGRLLASVEARFSLHAKSVEITLISVPLTGRVTQV